MRFSEWLLEEQQSSIVVPFQKLYGWKPKFTEAIQDIHDELFSRSSGDPITVSRLDSPRGSFFLMNGYHRVFEAMMQGQSSIEAKIDLYIPRIERTGGGYSGMVNNKIRITDAMPHLLS